MLLSNFCSVFCNEKNWWKTTPVYEVYVRSFKDSNGDGNGDLRGKKLTILSFNNCKKLLNLVFIRQNLSCKEVLRLKRFQS